MAEIDVLQCLSRRLPDQETKRVCQKARSTGDLRLTADQTQKTISFKH